MIEKGRQGNDLGRDVQDRVKKVVGGNLGVSSRKAGELKKILSIEKGILVAYSDGTYGYRTNVKGPEVKILAQREKEEEKNIKKSKESGLQMGGVLKISEALYEAMTILDKKGNLSLKSVHVMPKGYTEKGTEQPQTYDNHSIYINLNTVDLSSEKGKNNIKNAVYKQAVRNICTSSVKMSEMGWKLHEVYENIDDNRVEVHTNDYLEGLARTIEPEIKEIHNVERKVNGIIDEIKACSEGENNIISQYGTLYYENPKGLKECQPHYYAVLNHLSKKHSQHSAPMIKRLEVRPVSAAN